jgi:N-acetylglucosamine-6-sulfatase
MRRGLIVAAMLLGLLAVSVVRAGGAPDDAAAAVAPQPTSAKRSPDLATLAGLRSAVVPKAAGAVRATAKKKPKAPVDPRWNIVVIMTDDQPTGTYTDMRTVKRELIGRGTVYPTAMVPTPVCCPSRASFLTGLYAQGTGVYDNTDADGDGGYAAFKANGNEDRTFAVSLRDSGYHTGYFGKYLNEYAAGYHGWAPKGWQEWRAFATPTRSGDYRNYPVTFPYSKTDRKRIAAGKQPLHAPTRYVSQYSTTYFGKQTADFIRNSPKKKPFATVFAPYAPHSNFASAAKYRDALSDTGWWQSDPSIMEADVSDKPRWVGERVLGNVIGNKAFGEDFVKQRQTLLSVDDEVERILTALRDTKRLKNTVIIYFSDNGFVHGQHRLSHKFVPYKTATDVPLIVRWGNKLKQGLVDPRIAAANIDTYATIMQIAGLPNSNGYSLMNPAARSGVPLTASEWPAHVGPRPPYCGWRTATELYVRYGSGEEEYYDYTTDPYELQNRATDPAVAGRVDALRSLSRQSCVPPPKDYGPTFDEPIWKYSDPAKPGDGESDE